MTTYTIQRNSAPVAVSAMADAALTLIGKTGTDRKTQALKAADAVAIVAISHGKGKIAAQARDMKAEHEFGTVAESIANGNLHAFACKVGASLGESVKFVRRTLEDGTVIRTASQSFRDYAAVLDSKMLQLEVKGKDYTPKGQPTAAYAELLYLSALHSKACELMDERQAKDDERRAAMALADEVTTQDDKGIIEALEAGVTVQ